MVVILNLQNCHLLTLSLPTEEVFHIDGQNRPLANLPVVDFHLSRGHFFTCVVSTILYCNTISTILYCFNYIVLLITLLG